MRLFEPVVHELRRLRPDHRELAAAAEALRGAKAPLIVAGGGVHYSLAEARLRSFAEQHGVPVVETMAGKSTLVADHPLYAGPIGVTGAPQANALAAQADVVLAVGTRLQDFTTGSWTVFGNEDLRIVGLNAARFDAAKHRSLPLVADALEGLEALGSALGGWSAPQAWREQAHRQAVGYPEHVRRRSRRALERASRRTRRSSPPSTSRPARRTTPSRPPAASRASSTSTGSRAASRHSTASTASRAWATSSRAPGARAWRVRAARCSRSSATART